MSCNKILGRCYIGRLREKLVLHPELRMLLHQGNKILGRGDIEGLRGKMFLHRMTTMLSRCYIE